MWAFCGTQWMGVRNGHRFAFSYRRMVQRTLRENGRGRSQTRKSGSNAKQVLVKFFRPVGENSVSHAFFSLPASGVGKVKGIVSSY